MPPSPVVIALAGVEAEARDVAQAAGRAALVARTRRARGVLDDGGRPADRCANRRHRRHTGRRDGRGRRHACGVSRPRRSVRIHVVGVGIDVDEHRGRAAVDDGVGGRDPRERGHDHLVARADAEGGEREVQGGRATRRREGVRDVMTAREGFFEAPDDRALREPAALQRLAQCLPLLVAGRRQRDRRRAAVVHQASPRHSSSFRSPSSSGTRASNPISVAARSAEPIRLVTKVNPAGS